MKKSLTAVFLAAALLAGCASAGESSSSALPPASAPEPEWDTTGGVRADWSRLEEKRAPQPDVDGGRWYPERTDALLPRADYGPLVPYLGDQAYSFNRWEWEGEIQEYFSDWPTSFYGLMTREGKIVVDPVYQYAVPYTYTWEGQWRSLPVLLLARVDETRKDTNNGLLYAVAAEDGSWITGFEFTCYTNRGEQLFLAGPEGCTVLDAASGARRDWSWDRLEVAEEEVSEILSFVQWVTGLNWLEQGVCLGQKDPGANWEDAQARIFQPETGEVCWVKQGQWDQWCGAESDRRWNSDRWELLQEQNGVIVTAPDGQRYPIPDAPPNCFPYAEARDGRVILSHEDGGYGLYRLSDGKRLLEGSYLEFLTDPARPEGRAYLILRRSEGHTVYDPELNPVFTLPRTEGDAWIQCQLRDGLLCCTDNRTFFGCWDLERGAYVFYRGLGLGD